MSTKQQNLWIENIEQALSDAICAAAPENRNPYEWIGEVLWPSKSLRTAYARVKACLDVNQESTHFSPPEALMISKLEGDSGSLILHTYLCGEIGRTVGDKVAPTSPKALLLQKQAALAAKAVELQEEIDRIDAAKELKVVS